MCGIIYSLLASVLFKVSLYIYCFHPGNLVTLGKYYQTEIFEVMTDLTVIAFRLVCFSKMAADAIENSWFNILFKC